MLTELSFEDLIDGIRAGRQEAATALVQRYGPEIVRAVRLPMVRLRLHRVLDAADISQTVLANFFRHAGCGRYEIHGPEDLLKLLLTMARKKVLDEARRHQATRRDARRLSESAGESLTHTLIDESPSPSRIAEVRELMQEMYRRFTEMERYVAEQRIRGRGWADLAAELGGTAEGLRKKFERALERVSRGLGDRARS